MTVRSSTLARANLPDSITTTVATVPAGQTWIIRSAIMLCQEAGTTLLQCYVQAPAAGPRAWLIDQAVTVGTRVDFEGWVVALPGDSIVAFVGNDLGTLWVSGSKLAGVAP